MRVFGVSSLRYWSVFSIVVGITGMVVTTFKTVHAPSYAFMPLLLLGLIGCAVDDIRKAVNAGRS